MAQGPWLMAKGGRPGPRGPGAPPQVWSRAQRAPWLGAEAAPLGLEPRLQWAMELKIYFVFNTLSPQKVCKIMLKSSLLGAAKNVLKVSGTCLAQNTATSLGVLLLFSWFPIVFLGVGWGL